MQKVARIKRKDYSLQVPGVQRTVPSGKVNKHTHMQVKTINADIQHCQEIDTGL
jgi:hypothetical protein